MNWLERSGVGALALAAALSACSNPGTSSTRGSGSLALSQDDALLYAADTDNGIVAVVDVASKQKLASVKVGAAPVRVLVGLDDTLYVANRGDDSVSVIHRGDWAEAARLVVGVEPTGLALSPDGKTLYVTSSTARDSVDTGTLTAFDTRSLGKKWDLNVGPEPRAVAVVGDGSKALVSLFKQGDVVEVDVKNARVLKASAGVNEQANASRDSATPSPFRGGFSTFHARAVSDLVVTPDGARAFAPVVWAREDAIARTPTVFGGYYSSGGPCNVGAVATAGLVTFDTSGDAKPQVDDLVSCASATNDSSKDFPPTTLGDRSVLGGGGLPPVQGPTVGVVDPTGAWLFVVNRESHNVAVLPTYGRAGAGLDFERTGTTIRSVVDVGAGADGIALTKDGTRAFVYSQFDHRIDELKKSGEGDGAKLVNVGQPAVVAQDTLPAGQALGRRMFYDATDRRISSAQTNVACSTCHLEGRDDGHVWEFPDGPRQTPALAGRKLLSTAPYHWSGEFDTLARFSAHTITERMGGSGIDATATDTLAAYIDALPNAPSPLTADQPLVQQGKAVFAAAGCGTCHSGALLTDNLSADVGTLVLDAQHDDTGVVLQKGFNVPSLLGVARSAPYLHDGSVSTLEARIFDNPGNTHGVTSNLSESDKTALVAYLKSL